VWLTHSPCQLSSSLACFRGAELAGWTLNPIVSIGRDPQTGKLKRATFYGKTRQEVADKLTKALREKQQGIFVAPHTMTLGEWLDTWLQKYKKPRVRPSTFDSYEMLVRRHLKPALGHIALTDLRPEHVQHYCNEKRQQGLEVQTIHLHHITLSDVLTRAEKNQLVARNVGCLVVPPRQARKERRTLTLGQMTTQLLPTLKGHRLYAAFLTLFMVGLRRGELLGLRWQEVDGKSEVLHIR
jgi:integrase